MTAEHAFEASFSALVTGIATQAVLALGLGKEGEPNSQNQDLPLAKFNIDLLLVLQEKTEQNLENHEKQLLLFLIQDLQSKYLLIKETK